MIIKKQPLYNPTNYMSNQYNTIKTPIKRDAKGMGKRASYDGCVI